MPSLTANILNDTYEKSTIQFVWGGGSSIAAYGLTGSVFARNLTGYDSSITASGVGVTSINIDVTKIFWSAPQGSTGTALELAWGLSGSITGEPFLYLNGNGYVNYAADGIAFKNVSTNVNRNNSIQFRNVNAMGTNDVFSLVIELDKNGGYIRRM